MDVQAIATSQQAPSSNAISSLTENFDTFLTLLTTQLRNQDPLEPLDTEQFTQQLVQFASVEQSIQTNQNLEALIALQSASASEQALSMVGRIVTTSSDAATLGAAPAQWRYEMPDGVQSASLQVVDARGAVITTLPANIAPGAHDILWRGDLDDGTKAAPGTYRLVVSATGPDGGRR